MSSALGQACVLAALLMAAVGAPLGYVGGLRRSPGALRWTQRLAFGYAVAMFLACCIMWWALLQHDFSVSYVAQVGSLETPTLITIVSLWSSLEGSILFWGLVLGLYMAAVAYLQRRGHEDYLSYTLAVMLSVGIFFAFLISGPANPFLPTPPPIPTNGPGPNALLQNHVLMVIHPPMLYLGYVGMTVPFAMAAAALLRGQLGPTWLLPLRNWLLVPTGFLTIGIMLGGWWSYEVLGWGGYWAWDPVENASFLPWLTAIAALHSAIVLQRTGRQKAWTTILILISFLLTILGTFLTRSGVVNSVHSFTQSPIGPLFLAFLGVCLVGVVILLSLRIDTLVSDSPAKGGPTRELALLFNNLLLVGITFTVLVGTLFPIVAEAIKEVKVSVGEPFYNRMAVPIFLALLLLMGVGPALPWGRVDKRGLRRALLTPIPAAVVGCLIAVALGARSFPILWTSAFTGYALWVTIDRAMLPGRRRAERGEPLPRAFATAAARAPRRLGAYVAHFGVLMTFLAVAISASFQRQQEATLSPGESMEFESYTLTFEEPRLVEDPHRLSHQAVIALSSNGSGLGKLRPALNRYRSQREPIGTPAVRTRASHDLYLTLQSVNKDGTVGLRAIITPAVVWIWIGVGITAIGTALCLIPPLRGIAKPAARLVEDQAA